MTHLVPLFIPSPSISEFHLGPITIHLYALCILAGIMVAWVFGRRRFVARGGRGEQFENIAAVAVVCGIVGARIYHVLTDSELYFGTGRSPVRALYIWEGGLGIWGGVALGAVGAWLMARRYRLPFGDVADSIAPGLLVAQALGRLGNWFNQELFGRPTTRPWGLEIAPPYRPQGYEQFATFQPTFLYEIIWDLFAFGVLLWLERRFRLGRGRTFAAYIALYTFGRFFVERLRIDSAHTFAGLRLNDYTSIIVFIGAIVALVVLHHRRPGVLDAPLAPVGVPDAEADAHAAQAAEDAESVPPKRSLEPIDQADEAVIDADGDESTPQKP